MTVGKFNAAATIKTTNIGGHAAYSMQPKEKLMSQVLTSFVNEKKYYGDNTDAMKDTARDVIRTDPEFVAKLAVFARREFGMRSVSHMLAAMLAREPEGKPYARRAIRGACARGDDVTEIMACYMSEYGKPLPNQLKEGLSDAVLRLDEYAMAKYSGEGSEVKMRDVLCLCRPKPATDEQSAMFKRCLEGALAVPYTWETELSAHGNGKETWERLIASGKVGYMALLRNLRNIIEAEPGNIEDVWRIIEDPERVRKSRQLPFRFLSAYKSVAGICGSRGLDALETAAAASADAMEKLRGTTVIAVDVSGSMGTRTSDRSGVRYVEIGSMLGMIANKMCDDSVFYVFNSGIKKVDVSRHAQILREASQAVPSGGTDMGQPFAKMLQDGVKADRLIVVSDNECNSIYGGWGKATMQAAADECRRKLGKDFWVHGIDLAGYGTQQFHGHKVNIMAGWSDKTLKFVRLAEEGTGSLIKAIEDYGLR